MRQFHFILHRSCYRSDRNGNRDATRRSLDPVDVAEPQASGLTFGVDDDGAGSEIVPRGLTNVGVATQK